MSAFFYVYVLQIETKKNIVFVFVIHNLNSVKVL